MVKKQGTRDRNIPYRLLAYLLYGTPDSCEFVDYLGNNKVRLYTPECSQQLKFRIVQIWDTLKWLYEQGLIEDYDNEETRGTAVITLKVPDNIKRLKKIINE